MIPKPYLWIAAAAAVLLLLGVTAWKAYGLGEDHQRAEAQKKIDEANAKVVAADTRYDTLAGQQAGLLKTVQDLANRPPTNPQILVKQVPPDEKTGMCADRSSDYRMQYNAIAASNAVALAAQAVSSAADRSSGVQPP